MGDHIPLLPREHAGHVLVLAVQMVRAAMGSSPRFHHHLVLFPSYPKKRPPTRIVDSDHVVYILFGIGEHTSPHRSSPPRRRPMVSTLSRVTGLPPVALLHAAAPLGSTPMTLTWGLRSFVSVAISGAQSAAGRWGPGSRPHRGGRRRSRRRWCPDGGDRGVVEGGM